MIHYFKTYKKLETLGCLPGDAYKKNESGGFIISVCPSLIKQTCDQGQPQQGSHCRSYRFHKVLHKTLDLHLNNLNIKGSNVQLTWTHCDNLPTQTKLQFSIAAVQHYKKNDALSKMGHHFLGCLFITGMKPLFMSAVELQACFHNAPQRSLRVFRQTCGQGLKTPYVKLTALLKLLQTKHNASV